jgi:hypothetical protein
MAADDDEIARLLREVDAVAGASSAPVPAAQPATGKQVQAADRDEGGGMGARARWALIAGAGGGAVGLVAGTMLAFLPFVDGLSTAVGAAAGAMLTGLVGGPPRWLR